MDYPRKHKKLSLFKFLRFAVIAGSLGYVLFFCGSALNLFEGTPVSAWLHRGGPSFSGTAAEEPRFWPIDGVSTAVKSMSDGEAQLTPGGEPIAATTAGQPPSIADGSTTAPSRLKPIDGLSAAADSKSEDNQVVTTAGVLGSTQLATDESAKLLGISREDLNVSSDEEVASSSDQRSTPAEQEKPLVVVHTVRSGETLWDISKDHQVSMDTVIVANDLLNAHQLRIGQQIRVPSQDGVFYNVQRGDSLWTIAQRFGVSADEITAKNKIVDASRLRIGQELFVPGKEAVQALRYVLVGPDGKLRKVFERPVSGGWISSRFGHRWGRLHAGVDIAVSTGTPVRAAADGRVKFSGRNGGYGLLVTVDHGDSVETRYGHNSRLVAKVGQRVTRGQIIAYSGNTGNSTGPHLHFEIRLKGTPYDPLKYIR